MYGPNIPMWAFSSDEEPLGLLAFVWNATLCRFALRSTSTARRSLFTDGSATYSAAPSAVCCALPVPVPVPGTPGRLWPAVRRGCSFAVRSLLASLLSARCICSEMLLQIADARVLTAHLFPSIQAALLDPRRDPTPLVVLLDYSSFVSFGGKRGGISLLRSCVCT
jgi:hypothetical protein